MKNIIGKIRVLVCFSALCALLMTSGYAQTTATDDLPDGWAHEDIGETDVPGKVFYDASSGLYTVHANGGDTWSTHDDFHFLYFQTDEDKEIVLRVLSISGTEQWNKKCAIYIKGSLDTEATMAYCEVMARDLSVTFGVRPSDGREGGSAYTHANAKITGVPWWVKFVRQGSYISGYHKSNEEGAQWQQLGSPVKLAFKGTAYMGVGVCAGAYNSGTAIATFDNLVVQDIENPYYVKSKVATQFMEEGGTVDVDVTSIFGHYIGDYWTIQPTSSDENVVSASFWEKVLTEEEQANAEGEHYKKYIKLKANKDGIAAVKLYTNLMGYKMTTEFLVEVSGTTVPATASEMAPPTPWSFVNLEAPETPKPVLAPFKAHALSVATPLTIMAADFDFGGEGIAYHDNDANNQGGNNYRKENGDELGEGVDVEGGLGIGYTNAGEWLIYTVDVQDEGAYRVDVELSANQDGGVKYRFEVDGENSSGTISAPNNGAWGNFYFYDGGAYVRLPAGQHQIKFYLETGGFNFRAFKFTYEPSPPPPPVIPPIPQSYPFKDPVPALSSTATCEIKAVDFDLGGEGVAYHDNSSNNEGGNNYRKNNGDNNGEGPDIGGDMSIGWTNGGEWLKYTVDVAETGVYRMDIELTVNQGGGANYHFEVDGENETGSLWVRDNGSWGDFYWYNNNVLIKLTKGRHVFRFVLETGGFNFRAFRFTHRGAWDPNAPKSSLEYKNWRDITGGNSVEKLKVVTMNKNSEGLGDLSAFLYRKVSNDDQLEMKIRIDSLKNTGSGSFAGFMLRESLDHGAPFVSLGIGSYEGLRLSYRWIDNIPLSTRSLTDVNHPCWILLRKYKDPVYGNDLLTVHYSYDETYWQELLKYPLTTGFLANDLYVGVDVTGGEYTNIIRKGEGVMSNFTFSVNEEFKEIQVIGKSLDPLKKPLLMSPNILGPGSSATISYKVVKPGRVTLSVYDSFGRLVNTLFSGVQNIGEYTMPYTANLPNTGIYLLRLVAESDYQYIKFVYNK